MPHVLNELGRWSERHWLRVLLGVGSVLFVLNVLAFYPGFLSNDSIDQLTQAQADKPLEDWHPPAMALIWRVLIAISGGRVGSMLVWQCLLLWSSFVLLAIYIYQRTKRRRLSLLPLAFGLMPFVVSISGVIWKDVQMGAALLLAAVLLIVINRMTGRWRYAVLAIVALLIVYAVSLRYNAMLAVAPLLWLMARALPSRRVAGFVLALIVLCSLLGTTILTKIIPVAPTHPAASIMLDDIVHVYSVADIERLPIGAPTRNALSAVKQCHEARPIPVSVWIGCATEQELYAITRTGYNETKKVWAQGIVTHPVAYLNYRLGQFATLLLPRTPAEAYVWHDRIVPNHYGIALKGTIVTEMVEGYVQRFAFDFGFLCRPYMWRVAGVAVLIAAWRRRTVWHHAPYCIALAGSGIMYILSYIPVVAAYDFRYTYWACLAIGTAIIVACIDMRTTGHRHIKSKQ